jgi:thiol-disulfide isomerase/thioredoxin
VSVRVIQFTAPWCAPCKPVGRALAEVAPAYPGVVFDVVDLDEQPDEGVRYGVLVLPTVVIERDGEVAARLEGARKRVDYERALAKVVPAGELGG